MRATGAEVHVESTREWTLDDLVNAQIEFLSSRRAEEQIDDVPLVPKTKKRRWRLKGGPTNVNEDDALLDRAIGEANAERNVLLLHTQHNIELLQQEILKRASVCPHHPGDHSTEAQFVFNDMKTLTRHRRI